VIVYFDWMTRWGLN